MTSIRLSALLLTGAALAAPASAQDFNAAPPNAANQQPAFEGQTRAPVLEDEVTLDRAVVAEGLDHPWGMDQLPDGRWLVTERPGRLRIITPGGGFGPRRGAAAGRCPPPGWPAGRAGAR